MLQVMGRRHDGHRGSSSSPPSSLLAASMTLVRQARHIVCPQVNVTGSRKRLRQTAQQQASRMERSASAEPASAAALLELLELEEPASAPAAAAALLELLELFELDEPPCISVERAWRLETLELQSGP